MIFQIQGTFMVKKTMSKSYFKPFHICFSFRSLLFSLSILFLSLLGFIQHDCYSCLFFLSGIFYSQTKNNRRPSINFDPLHRDLDFLPKDWIFCKKMLEGEKSFGLKQEKCFNRDNSFEKIIILNYWLIKDDWRITLHWFRCLILAIHRAVEVIRRGIGPGFHIPHLIVHHIKKEWLLD